MAWGRDVDLTGMSHEMHALSSYSSSAFSACQADPAFAVLNELLYPVEAESHNFTSEDVRCLGMDTGKQAQSHRYALLA